VIVPVTPEHFDAIARIDVEGFGRSGPRSPLNLQSLVDTSEGLAFAYLHQGQPVGYIFSRRLGKTAYIGPLGVRADVQDRGVGRELMLASMEGLKATSEIIGLEVRPHNVKAIGLYSKLGFACTYPSLNYPVPSCAELEVLAGQSQFGASGGSRLGAAGERRPWASALEFEDIVETANSTAVRDLARFCKNEYGDIDFSLDLDWAIKERNGWVIVARRPQGEIAGFVALVPELLDMVWGAVARNAGPEAVTLLLRELRRRSPDRDMVLRVNARHTGLCSYFARSGLRLQNVTTRMLLGGYEGDGLLPSDRLMMRAWIG